MAATVALAAVGAAAVVAAAKWGGAAFRAVKRWQETGAARVGTRIFEMRGVGARSRLFGDKYTPGGRPGLLNTRNKDSRFGIGWSGKHVDGYKTARTVFRVKFGSKKRHLDLFHGPWRPGKK